MLTSIRLWLLFVLVAVFVRTLDAAEKLAVPAPEEQRKQLDLVRDVFGDEYKAATSRAEKVAFAKKLLGESLRISGHPSEQYALFRVAMEAAIQAGDVTVTFDAIDEMGKRFDIDLTRARGSVLQDLSKTIAPEGRADFLNGVSQVVKSYTDRDEYAPALSLADTALHVARRARDARLIRQVASGRDRLKQMSEQFREVEAARETLKIRPTDPTANEVVGQYLCFVKQDWEQGLLMLALANDETLKKIAASELTGAESLDNRLALADAWFDLAEQTADESKSIANQAKVGAMQARSRHWYEQVVRTTTGGLVRAKAIRRLRTLSETDEGAVHPALRYAIKPHPPDAVQFNGHWYKHIKGSPTWLQAFHACREMGGHLICVETREEAELLRKFHHCWIGAVKRDDKWSWLNGADFTFTSWRRGQPNASGPNATCTYTDPHGNWVASEGIEKPAQIYGFVCEWPE